MPLVQQPKKNQIIVSESNNRSAHASRAQTETDRPKMSQVIESRFKNEKLSKATDDSTELMRRNYYLCVKFHSQCSRTMIETFESVLKESVLDLFLNNLNIEIAYSDTVDAMKQ